MRHHIRMFDSNLDCAAIIARMEKSDGWYKPPPPDEDVLSVCPIKDPILDNQIFQCANRLIQEYTKEFTHVKVDRDEGYKIMKYDIDGEFPTHIDQCLGKVMYSRSVSMVIYLNEDFEGGDTVFPDQEYTIRPKTGKAILFPSSYAYPHQSVPIKSGTKYIIATWFHFPRPYWSDLTMEHSSY